MRSALYYPHTEVKSDALVRSALLTWDRLEFIVPRQEYKPHYANRDMAEAMELIGHRRVPDQAEQDELYKLLEDLIESGTPETFTYQTEARLDERYEIWPEKLLNRSWSLLEERGLVGAPLDNDDYPATQAGGLTLMSMLADVMAGETRARVTDRGLAYAALANAPSVPPTGAEPDVDFAAILPVKVDSLSAESFTLRQLIELRKREESSGGTDLRNLRHHYLDSVQAHVKVAARFAPGSPDRIETDRVFEKEMENKLRDLKTELSLTRNDALLSKESLTCILAVGGLVAAGIAATQAGLPMPVPAALSLTGAPITVGGALRIGNKYAAKRREILRANPMAYIYQASL